MTVAFKTIEWTTDGARIIDQTRLPEAMVLKTIRTPEEMWHAIKRLEVRGAPAIGIAAAFGVYLGVWQSQESSGEAVVKQALQVADYLATSRPTAVNLFWALDRMRQVATEHRTDPPERLKARLLEEARRILDEDTAVCRAIGEHGLAIVPEGANVLTHCNAGALATSAYGTALAPIYLAHEQGRRLHVWVDETRPLLQGARLTAWELTEAGVPATLITDNMAASLMGAGKIDLAIVGADRVTANGDVANKIGTYGVAVLAHAHGIPFYVACPISTIDMRLASGDQIPIEQRNPDEVTRGFGRQTAPDRVAVYNPAFDVTPHRYVTGIITERGIVYPPYGESLARLVREAGEKTPVPSGARA